MLNPLLIAIVLISTAPAHVQCLKAEECYLSVEGVFCINDEKLDHQKAQDYCHQQGGQLAVVDSAAKWEIIANVTADTDKSLGKHEHYFVGLKRTATGSTQFSWEDAKRTVLEDKKSFTNWCPKEPNDIKEECVAVYLTNGQYCWDDIFCHMAFYFVCEFEPIKIYPAE